MKRKNTITQKELKERLHYNPETGVFTWWDIEGYNRYTGRRAGSLNTRDGYRYIRFNRKLVQEHNLAWLYIYGSFSLDTLDHINHIRDDNKIKNLRFAGKAENAKNAKLSKKNKSGCVGVYPYLKKGKWLATIGVNSKMLRLGIFNTKEEAIKVRKEAEVKHRYHPNHGLKEVVG